MSQSLSRCGRRVGPCQSVLILGPFVSVRVNTWSVPCQSVLMMSVSIRVMSIHANEVVRVNPCRVKSRYDFVCVASRALPCVSVCGAGACCNRVSQSMSCHFVLMM